MTKSLKEFTSVLGKQLKVSPCAIYERQRALVSAGLLKAPIGRGPGNGVPASPFNVAMILISLLATDRLSESVDATTRVFATAPPKGRLCSLTGSKSLAGALTDIFMKPTLARHVFALSVSRHASWASIQYTLTNGEIGSSDFGSLSQSSSEIHCCASVSGDLLKHIAVELAHVCLI